MWRAEQGWVANKQGSADSALVSRRLSPNDLLDLLHHTYRVLLTRGVKGTFICSTDEETTAFLRSTLIASMPG